MKILRLVLVMMSFAAPLSALAGITTTPVGGSNCAHSVEFPKAAAVVNKTLETKSQAPQNVLRATTTQPTQS